MKTVSSIISNDKHFKFKNKCKYYDYTVSEVLSILVDNFIAGKYDEDLNIPKED